MRAICKNRSIRADPGEIEAGSASYALRELLVNEKEGPKRPFLFTYINNFCPADQASSPLAEIFPNLYWKVTFTSRLVWCQFDDCE